MALSVVFALSVQKQARLAHSAEPRAINSRWVKPKFVLH